MVAAGGGKADVVFVAAERERFTPWGACLDWIFELGGEACHLWVHNHRNAKPVQKKASPVARRCIRVPYRLLAGLDGETADVTPNRSGGRTSVGVRAASGRSRREGSGWRLDGGRRAAARS